MDSDTSSTQQNRRKITPFYRIHPLYERLRHMRGGITIFEGIIGAGKSTASKKLRDLLEKVGIPVKLFEEDVDPLLLDLFLSDMKKYAFAFQMTMLVQRQKIYMQALDFARRENGVSIIDRSLSGDGAFVGLHVDYGNISDKEYDAYLSVMSGTALPEPSKIIYLDVTPEVAYERIKARNRGQEASKYTLEYLHDLDVNYKVAMEESRIPVQYLDCNAPSLLPDDELVEICDFLNPSE